MHTKTTEKTPHKMLVEGWRFFSHSYAMVNQWQMLALLHKRNITLAAFDMPFQGAAAPQESELFDQKREALLRTIRRVDNDLNYDFCYRISYPYALKKKAMSGARCRKVLVFGTAEHQHISNDYLAEYPDLNALNDDPDFFVVTPSRWSSQGFVNLGFHSDRIKIIPHGIDSTIFNNSRSTREEIRRRLGLTGFVFMTCGAMTHSKGMDVLLSAFCAVAQKHEDAQLLFKGTDSLYSSREALHTYTRALSADQQKIIREKAVYIGNVISVDGMASLYQAADAYVSPYRAEGFNLPVLEAAACGLPILCTDGGSTDDFVNENFCWKINSTLNSAEYGCWLEPDVHHLIHLMERVVTDVSFGRASLELAPIHVSDRYDWNTVVQKIIDVGT